MNIKKFTNYKVSFEHQGLTLEQYLKTILKISGRKLQKLTRTKGIFINNNPVITPTLENNFFSIGFASE